MNRWEKSTTTTMLEGVRDVYISSLSEQKDHHHAQSTMHSMSLF